LVLVAHFLNKDVMMDAHSLNILENMLFLGKNITTIDIIPM